jgi:hypothetical protein
MWDLLYGMLSLLGGTTLFVIFLFMTSYAVCGGGF